MPTLQQLLTTSRAFALETAIVATFRPLFEGVEVKEHPGTLDIVDVVTKDVFRAPSLAVAVTRQRSAEHRSSGQRDVPVDVTVYVVAEDTALGNPQRAYSRGEIGKALCDGVLAVVENDQLNRWGLQDIGHPENAEGKPVFTAKSFERGTAFYAVTWRQMLYGLGDPFWDMSTPVPNDIDPRVYLPGDLDYPTGGTP